MGKGGGGAGAGRRRGRRREKEGVVSLANKRNEEGKMGSIRLSECLYEMGLKVHE